MKRKPLNARWISLLLCCIMFLAVTPAGMAEIADMPHTRQVTEALLDAAKSAYEQALEDTEAAITYAQLLYI